MSSLRWTSVLITGGSTGIGAALARRLSQRGAHVVIVARRQEPIDTLVAELGERVTGIVADVADPERARAVVDEAHARLGKLDLVIANAGMGINAPAHELRLEHDIPVLQLNVLGACATLTAAIPHLLAGGGGTLVGVSSLAAMRGLPTSAAYSASKAALSTFLESLRVELVPRGIDVSDIRPGFVDTPLTQKNGFRMPFLMTADDAAQRIVRGLERRRRIIAFPWPTALAMRLLAGLPSALFEGLGRLSVSRRS